MKENLLAMAKLAADLDLDRRPLMELLRKVLCVLQCYDSSML